VHCLVSIMWDIYNILRVVLYRFFATGIIGYITVMTLFGVATKNHTHLLSFETRSIHCYTVKQKQP
jgi:hypothetical protein